MKIKIEGDRLEVCRNKKRGKRLGGKDGEWLIGSLYDDGGELYILPPFPGSAIDYEDY